MDTHSPEPGTHFKLTFEVDSLAGFLGPHKADCFNLFIIYNTLIIILILMFQARKKGLLSESTILNSVSQTMRAVDTDKLRFFFLDMFLKLCYKASMFIRGLAWWKS